MCLIVSLFCIFFRGDSMGSIFSERFFLMKISCEGYFFHLDRFSSLYLVMNVWATNFTSLGDLSLSCLPE